MFVKNIYIITHSVAPQPLEESGQGVYSTSRNHDVVAGAFMPACISTAGYWAVGNFTTVVAQKPSGPDNP